MFLSKCPLCACSNIHQVEGTVERKICGELVHIPSVKYWFCSNCKEKIFFPESMKIMNDYIRQHENERVLID